MKKRQSKPMAPDGGGGMAPSENGKSPATGISADELERLKDALREAQETLNAIRRGEVDAVVISGESGDQVYSLAGAEQPYRVYVEQMQEGAVTVSLEGTILYCNQRFAAMAAVPLERSIGADLQQFVGGEVWTELAKVFASGAPVKREAALRRISGPPLPVLLSASQLLVGGQRVMCLVVTDLTAQLESTQLRVGKEIAEKASLAKDSFLAILSHELRTPLNPALMTAMALERDESLPPATRKDLAMIRRNVELESRLIDDLLDLTRIAQGKLELHTGPLDLHQVLLGALDVCRAEIEAKQQQLVLNLQARHHRTTGDAVRVQQVIWNLLRNASKFTPDAGTITISTGDEGESRVWVEVRDTGIGFDTDAAPRMFLPFEQGGRHITRQFGGLGLGLAISRSIAEAHGGSIRATSQGQGLGAAFTLELPVAATALPPTLQAKARIPVLTAPSGRRILLVEDHRDTRISMEYLLQRAKHQVWSASTASEALALASEHQFDIVVTDLGLPDQNGMELMRQLRDRHGLKGIATSGYGMEEDISRSREAGFIHHLTKPINMDQLRRVLGELEASGNSAA